MGARIRTVNVPVRTKHRPRLAPELPDHIRRALLYSKVEYFPAPCARVSEVLETHIRGKINIHSLYGCDTSAEDEPQIASGRRHVMWCQQTQQGTPE
ncbi:hypothetical protein BN2476_740091 [Paraburkholderia piptadeniae]|uniref:Uncharacterized protein n=1 Tax=Paraburkholderia piptadeniae TaxID=1701573 RepID=A0A1N7SRM0_9BURK|nr:hypothetical protein BN2476_740091 [Paraburkholderia piptadeniae]